MKYGANSNHENLYKIKNDIFEIVYKNKFKHHKIVISENILFVLNEFISRAITKWLITPSIKVVNIVKTCTLISIVVLVNIYGTGTIIKK